MKKNKQNEPRFMFEKLKEAGDKVKVCKYNRDSAMRMGSTISKQHAKDPDKKFRSEKQSDGWLYVIRVM